MSWDRATLPAAAAGLLLLCIGCQDGARKIIGAGAQAGDYLLTAPYANLTLEVDLMGNVAANPYVRDIVLGKVRKTLNKPGKVDMLIDRPDRAFVSPPGGYTVDDILEIEELHRDTRSEGDVASLYVVYLPGHLYDGTTSSGALGVAYSPTSMAVFPDAVAVTCAPGSAVIEDPEARALLCPLTEAATWLHEVGHLIGLVDNGIPMVVDHLDKDHIAHDSNEQCIMHWSHESGKLAKFIESRLKNGKLSIDVFDQACQDDMAAFVANGGVSD